MRIIFIGMLLLSALGVEAQNLLSKHAFEDVLTADSVAANLQVSSVSALSGTILFQNGTDDGGLKLGYIQGGWPSDTFNAVNRYLEYTISPQNSFSLTISSLSFRFGRTSAGPTKVAIRWSDDDFVSFTTILYNATVTSTATGALDAFTISQQLPQNSTVPIKVRIWAYESGTGNLRFNNFRVFGTLTAPAPTINLSPSTLNGFSTDSSQASATQSFELSGNNFTSSGNLLVNASGTAYEVSTNNSSFSSQVQVAHGTGNLVSTTVYVRLKSGLANGTYNQQIPVSGGGATTVNLNVNGSVNRPVVVSTVAGGSLRLSVDSLVFNTTNENQSDSGFVTLYNEGGSTLQGRIRQFHIYNHQPFWTPDSVFSIAAGDSLRLKIYFTPRHNILNKGVMVVDVRTGTGPKYIKVRGQGTYSRSYYANSQNQTGAALVTALRTITGSPYQVLTYSGTNNARLRMFYIVDNWKVNGREPNHNEAYKNECIYTGRTITYNTQLSTGTINLSPYSMNAEHTWPQSMGADNDPMESDLHHLFVCDGGTNSARGNKPLGNVPSPTLTYSGGSKANSTVFEPRDAQKGTSARAMFYFAMRYGNAGTTQFTWISPYESDLRGWHALYPPDSIARRRNDDVQTYQLNRNPFVDYPQLLDRITNLLTASPSSPVLWGLYVPDSLLPGNLSVGQQRTYRVPVVNHGTETIELSGIAVTGTGLSYAGSTNRSIAPGELVELEVSLQFGSAGQPSGQLQFSTNVPGQTSMSLPLAALVERSRWSGTGDWTQAASWNNGFVPVSSSQPLVESGELQITDSRTVGSLEIAANATLRLQSGAKLITTGNLVNNGIVVLENGASLLPDENATVSGNGTFQVKRNGQSSNLRVNYWSSPVENANISTSFPLANPLDIRRFMPGGNTVAAWQQAAGTLLSGHGYSVAGAGNVTFSGKIHHGDYQPLATLGAGGYYLLGNPYPAPLSADAFLALNGPAGLGTTAGTLYFWTQQQQANGSNFSSGDYAIWAGGTGVAGSGSNAGSQVPNGEIGVAQGFFVEGGSLAFDVYIQANMRSSGNSGQFFRTTGPLHRFWINAIGQLGGFSQLAMVFRQEASTGHDPAYDAPRINAGAPLVFSTKNNGRQYAIQALPPLEVYGNVGCELHLNQAQNVRFTIDSLDGIPSDYAIYLEDRATNRFYHLRDSSAAISLNAGSFPDRFYLHWGQHLTSSTKFHSATTVPDIYAYNGWLYARAGSEVIQLEILSMAGQRIHLQKLEHEEWRWQLPAPGIYLVRWHRNGKTGHVKIKA